MDNYIKSPDNPLFQSPNEDSLLEAAAAGGDSAGPTARKNLTFETPPATVEQPPPVTATTMSQLMATIASVAEATQAIQRQATYQQLQAVEQQQQMMQAMEAMARQQQAMLLMIHTNNQTADAAEQEIKDIPAVETPDTFPAKTPVATVAASLTMMQVGSS